MKVKLLQLTARGSSLTNKRAFALIDVILGASLFLIIVTFAVPALLYGQESTRLSGQRQRAVVYAEEGLEALRNLRDANFSNLSIGGPYGLATSSGVWSLNGTSTTDGEFTRQILIGNLGTDRLIATSTVTWRQNEQRSNSISLSTYFTNWEKTLNMPIEIVASASNPADNGTRGGPTATITPPSSLQVGDVIILIVNYRSSSGNISILNTGGQTWTTLSQVGSGTTNILRIFYTVYNGTWSANPSVTVGSGSTALTVLMHALRNVDPNNVLDVPQTTGSFSAPSGLRDVTISGINTITDNALILAVWATGDDNTWRIQTPGWSNLGLAQYRNLSGSDSSISTAYKIAPLAGASGNVTNRQLTNGGDAGRRAILAFKPKP